MKFFCSHLDSWVDGWAEGERVVERERGWRDEEYEFV
jgi:hypothetical protein